MNTLEIFGASTLALLAYKRSEQMEEQGYDGKCAAYFALSLICLAYIGLKALSEVVG